MKFNQRKRWHFKGNKSIHFEISGWTCNPSIYLRVDGGESQVTLHIGLGIGLSISFARFLPEGWYPSYISKYGYGRLGCEKKVSVSFHGGSIWWCFWKDDDESFRTSWRKGCFHLVDIIKGKHIYNKNEVERNVFVLPFLEGNYNVEVIRFERIDKWQRWFTSKMISFEVRAGYYQDGRWVEKGIPVEGKGENSWDCDEDATYSMSFPGQPYKKEIVSCYDAAMHFHQSMIKDRARRGGANWLPKSHESARLAVIK
jgi:hypothetical protein